MWAELNKLASEKNMTQFKIFNLNKFFSEVAIVAANKICIFRKLAQLRKYKNENDKK